MAKSRAREEFAKTCWEEITSYGNLHWAYKRSGRGRIKYKRKASYINIQFGNVIDWIRGALIYKEYTFQSYHKFVIKDKKTRECYVPTYRDKIVQMAITNIVTPFLTQLAITDTYACIKGRGTMAAAKQIWRYMRAAKRRYGEEGVFLKLDVSKFFYTVDRDILKQLLAKDILCPNTLDLMYKCIDSFKLTDVGLPLGNVISQHLANYYLNNVDHMIKRDLKVKYYVRYADDLFLFLPNKDIAKYVRDIIINYVSSKLNLTINPVKTYITKIKMLTGLGYKFYLDRIDILRRNRKNFRKFVRARSIPSLNSWYGCNQLAKCHTWIHNELVGTNIIFDGRRFWDLTKTNKEYIWRKMPLQQPIKHKKSICNSFSKTEIKCYPILQHRK